MIFFTVAENPKTEVRGLFQDFYTKQMQTQGSHTMSSTSGDAVDDFGEKITSLVAQTAVAMADAGQQTVQQILVTMGGELGEALKFWTFIT